MRQDLEYSCWWGKEHGGEIGIKRKAMEEKERGEKKVIIEDRERRRFFFLSLEIGMECIK